MAVEYLYAYLEQYESDISKKANHYRMLALYMDIRCFDEDIRKMKKLSSIVTTRGFGMGSKKNSLVPGEMMTSSMISNLSVDIDTDYSNNAKDIAINIFDEYLRNGAANYVFINDKIRCLIFNKFGCTYDR